MHQLKDFIGREQEVDSVSRALRDYAQHHRAAAVGAVQVTCADESEREAAESFQHWFADALLPELKFSSKSPLRLASLGARYEWGAIRIAENHFATPETQSEFKLLLVKLNAHVSLVDSGGEVTYGKMDRYSAESEFCTALHALLGGRHYPAMHDLHEAFSSDGIPRLEMLRDHDQVDPAVRSLLAAVVSSRVQARRAIVDIQDYTPITPTVYVVLPCVTLNRKQRDTEFVVGTYTADFRDGPGAVQYYGLGDDPSRYRVQHSHRLLRIEDDQLQQPRDARDHREEVLRQWQKRRSRTTVKDARVKEIAEGVARQTHHDASVARETLKTLLWLLADLSPVPASILLFAKGAASIHHMYRVQRMARGRDDHHGAKAILHEVTGNVDHMSPEKARSTIESMLDGYHVHSE